MTDIQDVSIGSRFLHVMGGKFSNTMVSASSNTASNTAGQVVTGATDAGPMLQSDSTGRKFGVTVRLEATQGAVNVVALTDAPLFTVGTSEPKIPDTNIPLYRIAALLDGGMRVAEVMEDFPSLTADQIVMARDYARQHPNFGKPYPKKSLKRLLRNSGFAELEQTLRRRKKRS
jgi:uncharacterized protein (DUF433 family)